MQPNERFYKDQIFREFQNVGKDEGLLKNCEHQYFLTKLIKKRIVEKRVIGREYNVRMSPFSIKELPNAKIFHFNEPKGKPWRYNFTETDQKKNLKK